ncbi:MAG: hypothetical protein AAGE52_04505 [Myxococcota bacterium]
MAWEPFEQWPGETRGGAFREQSEPVVAERAGPSTRERLRLFWSSQPDFPSAKAARRLALTATYVYVQRFDGDRRRVVRSKLRGLRRTSGLLIAGVVDDDDLIIPHREGCEAEAHLLKALSRSSGTWTHRVGVGLSVFVALLFFVVGAGLLSEYPFSSAVDAWRMGLTTAERVLGFGAAVAFLTASLMVTLWGSSRFRISGLGVERTRGLIPWMPFFVPAESITEVWVLPSRQKRSNSWLYVRLRFRERQRFGSMFGARVIPVAVFLPRQRREAVACGERIARLLGCTVHDRTGGSK